MLRLFRWLVRLTVGLVALVAVSLILLYWFFDRSIPD